MCIAGFFFWPHLPRHFEDYFMYHSQSLTVTPRKWPSQFHSDMNISKYLSGPAVSNPATKNLRERRSTDLPVLDVHTVAREEGEGMETTDTESVSSASTYVQSLEQLLNSPEAKPGRWDVAVRSACLHRLQKFMTSKSFRSLCSHACRCKTSLVKCH